MSKNDNKKPMSDDQLKAFLQKHQPVAPAPAEAQLPQLLEKLGIEKPKRRRWQLPVFAFGSALAAGIAAILLMGRAPIPNEVPDTQAEVVQEFVESDWDDSQLYEADLPALDVGEDYMDLVASN